MARGTGLQPVAGLSPPSGFAPRRLPEAVLAVIPMTSKILLASMVKLADGLERAFDSNAERDDWAGYERARYVHALRAMSDFLRANNAPLRYAQRLNRLAVALADL